MTTSTKFKIGAIIAGVIIVILLIGMAMCTTNIHAGYVGVIYNMNGGIESRTIGQGWTVMPPWKHVTEYPVSTETVYLSKSGKEGGSDDDSVNAGTSDGKPVNMDVSYTYHFDPTKLPQIYTKFKGQRAGTIADTFIRREIKDDLNRISTQYGIFDVYGTKRAEVADKVYKLIKTNLEAYGIMIESFNITDVRPDAETQKAIQNKINAIQALEQIKVEKEKAVIEAEKKKIDAEGEANKTKIAADAQAYANLKLQQSATDQVIALEWIKKWDGKLSTVQGSSSGNIIDINSVLKAAGK